MASFLPLADETSFEAGIRVQIHSQDEPPYIHQLGFGVSPGFQTFVSCQEQRVKTMRQGKMSAGLVGWEEKRAPACVGSDNSKGA